MASHDLVLLTGRDPDRVELARFRVRPERIDDLLAAYSRMLEEFRGGRAGFIDAHLVRLPNDEWLDVIRWRSSQDFAASRAKGANLPGMKAFVDAIDSFVSVEEGSLADAGSG